MAVSPNKKRRRSAKESEDESTNSSRELKIWKEWVNPPEYWDNLPDVLLTLRSLEEVNRRHKAQPLIRDSDSPPVKDGVKTTSSDLTRFARRGGPDLQHLQGYWEPRPKLPLLGGILFANPKDSYFIAASRRMFRVGRSPCDRNMEQHLTDIGVYATYSSQRPTNLAQIKEALRVRRPSLSEDVFSDEDFERYAEMSEHTRDEDDVQATVVPLMLGSQQQQQQQQQQHYYCARNTVFGNLKPLSDVMIIAPKPDFYDGAHPEQLSKPIRDSLSRYIIPSRMHHKPMAPNFFLEIKGPHGSGGVGKTQARYDGAVGARGIHALQNYGNALAAVYDGRAYTFSATYYIDQVSIYAHHLREPVGGGGGGGGGQQPQPEYHMSLVGAYCLLTSRDAFEQGVGALRNARDLAKQYRDEFVDAADKCAVGGVCPLYDT